MRDSRGHFFTQVAPKLYLPSGLTSIWYVVGLYSMRGGQVSLHVASSRNLRQTYWGGGLRWAEGDKHLVRLSRVTCVAQMKHAIFYFLHDSSVQCLRSAGQDNSPTAIQNKERRPEQAGLRDSG